MSATAPEAAPPTPFAAARAGYGVGVTAVIKRVRWARPQLYQGPGPAWHWKFEAWIGSVRLNDGNPLKETLQIALCHADTIVESWEGAHRAWKRGPRGALIAVPS